MNFNINISEGINFSKKSGDFNKIHLKEIEGYNSIFGEIICHGCLVIEKFLNKINFLHNTNKNIFSVQIIFKKHFSYNKKILIKKNRNKYILNQDNINRAEINITNSNSIKYKNLKRRKIFKLKNKLENNIKKEINLSLNNLSKYVGNIYPGKNSAIREVAINFNKNYNFGNNFKVYSKNLSKKYPIINNKLTFRNLLIEFETINRKLLKIKKIKPSYKIINIVKKINNNILIIGASSGIGNEVLNLFKNNKKIIIFGTYYKNKITNSKNLKFFKFDINKPNKKIDKLLKKLKNGYIYYFATPKIDIKNNDAKQASIYKQYYINYPLELLKKIKNYNIKFFYPSTILTKNSKKNTYSMVKKSAEKILKIKFKNFSLNILRIEEINTKQNLSSVHKNKYPQFIELLNKNLEYQKKIFFFN